MMRRMTVTGGEVHQERIVRRDRMLGPNPVDGAISHVVDKNVVRVAERRQNRLCVLEQGGMPVVRIAAQEAVEVFKAETACPLVEWSGCALLPVRNQMVFAEPRRVVAVARENVADGARALGNDRIVAGIAGCKLRDGAVADAVMVASRKKGGARRGAQCGGVELIVANPALVNSLQARRRDRAAEGAGCAEAGVIGHDQQYVRRTLGRSYCWGVVRSGFTRLAADDTSERLFGGWEDCRTSSRC